MSRHLIVSATRAEARHVPEHLPVIITGMGKTAAAVATARALATQPRTDGLVIVNIGTAGALRDGMSGVYEPGSVLNHELSADVIRSFGGDPQERLVLTGGDPDLTLATGDIFIADTAVRDRLAQVSALVDMEGYAVAYAAQEFGVPVRLVKHVSDNADQGAMSWPELVDASARELGRWLSEHCGD